MKQRKWECVRFISYNISSHAAGPALSTNTRNNDFLHLTGVLAGKNLGAWNNKKDASLFSIKQRSHNGKGE